jgi:pyridinium-3,5-biscarboxylic acid mononucleotide sulfurtransferase
MNKNGSQLEAIIRGIGPSAIAVSGGVDSLTLATLASRLVGPRKTLIVHAISAAVPIETTDRVRVQSVKEGWRLELIDAGEFADADNRRNPVNRCYFCKGNLYGAIRSRTDRQILSGANLDDLNDYRPGLKAANLYGVRHPFIEADLPV